MSYVGLVWFFFWLCLPMEKLDLIPGAAVSHGRIILHRQSSALGGEGKRKQQKHFSELMGSRTSFHSRLEGKEHKSSSTKLFWAEICSVLFELGSKLFKVPSSEGFCAVQTCHL